MIETLAEARDAGVRLTVRCAWGRREGIKTSRECKAAMRLYLDTLVWTRGAAFPVSMLEGRLKCPACGSRKVVLPFIVVAAATLISFRPSQADSAGLTFRSFAGVQQPTFVTQQTQRVA
jgi:hypothetical protein